MADPVRWEGIAQDGEARRGRLHTPHGSVDTPAFMPVGTRATVRALDSQDLAALGAQMVLANTYHLMLRPGSDRIERLGGLHRFMAWDGPILTDSGGYQVFSLQPKVSEDGVTFKSTYDGSTVHLTPERAVVVQETLGSDIAMALDVLVGLPSERAVVEAAMERTLRWLERSVKAKQRTDRALFGIVQGGVDPELRKRSARETASFDVAGYGIGGLSVGESAPERNAALEAAIPELLPDKPRYVMGLGDTEGILDAVARGSDLFDCVLPTRLARHGKALTRIGDFSVKRAEFARDESPIEPGCPCLTCTFHARGYLRHLFATNELTGLRLLTLHNVTYTLRLMADIRQAITAGRFATLADDIKRRRQPVDEGHPG